MLDDLAQELCAKAAFAARARLILQRPKPATEISRPPLGDLLAYLFFHITMLASPAASLLIVGGWAADVFLFCLLSILVLDRTCPWNKLVITAEFDGILPREAREKARTAGDHFDKLYLIVDQQHRWKSALLPDPRPRSLDPLLIGELTRNGRHEFFLTDQFDLTEAEQYIADEFATTLDSVNCELSSGRPYDD